MDNSGFISLQINEIPAFYSIGTGALSPGIRRPGRESDHSSSHSSAEVKDEYSFNSIVFIAFMA